MAFQALVYKIYNKLIIRRNHKNKIVVKMFRSKRASLNVANHRSSVLYFQLGNILGRLK